MNVNVIEEWNVAEPRLAGEVGETITTIMKRAYFTGASLTVTQLMELSAETGSWGEFSEGLLKLEEELKAKAREASGQKLATAQGDTP